MYSSVKDYPIKLNRAFELHSHSLSEGQIAQALQTCCNEQIDNLIFPIFSDEFLHQLSNEEDQGQLLDLDKCLIPSDTHYKKKLYSLMIPQINKIIWNGNFSLNFRLKTIGTIIGYSGFLKLKNYLMKISLKGDENSQQDQKLLKEIVQCFTLMKKNLLSCGSTLNLIIQLDGSQGDQNNFKNQNIWRLYLNLRKQVNIIFNYKLKYEIGIKINKNLPNKIILDRWKSEGLKFILVDQQAFSESSEGFLALSPEYKRIILQFIDLKACVTISTSNQKLNERILEKIRYIENNFQEHALDILKNKREVLNFVTDDIQIPIQPYADNLDSQIYDLFQNDKIKYDEYQRALEQALQKFDQKHKIVIYYIGAGRGGLMISAFAAATKKQREIFMYLIEKNPYSIQTLKKRVVQNKWQQKCKIVNANIKDYEMPEKPDIFLSELLGGFGDNQLSPECLCWAQKNISEDTICIPKSSHSYIRPISYQSTHRSLSEEERHVYYMVKLGRYFSDFTSQLTWQFIHPLKEKQKEFNKESGWLEFQTQTPMMINGFAGYFNSPLYGDTEITILPEKIARTNECWAPLFFPFDKELMIQRKQKILIRVCRKHTQKGVWYEWQYSFNGEESIIHNKDGCKIMISFI